MNTRFDEELFLTSKTGSRLYHEYAENLPIIDYHCHLMTSEICEDKEFEDLGEMWLRGDHYKWRAMRTFGIDEKYITGEADYHDKYLAFASVFPMMIGNPVYIWCALELKRYFDIDEPSGQCRGNLPEDKGIDCEAPHDQALVHGALQCQAGEHHRGPGG